MESMWTQHPVLGDHEKFTKHSPHLYLEGVVKIESKLLPQLMKKLEEPSFILDVTKEAAGRIFGK